MTHVIACSTQMRSKSWLLGVFHGVSYLQQMFSVNINLSGAACVSKVISAVCCWVGCWWVMQKFGWDNSCGLADPHFSFPTNKQLKSQVLRQCCYNRKGQTQTTPFLVYNTVPRNKASRLGQIVKAFLLFSRHLLWTIHRVCCVDLQAIEAGQGSKDDWAEFKYRHRQAEQDSHLLYSVLQQAEQFHQVRCCYMAWNRNIFDVSAGN